ncbi:UBX domain-containing protein 7 [Tyrophagus putrescentiae]|nr:UBX domain-containing protein 7 [Tyrophagus putrescentiae]
MEAQQDGTDHDEVITRFIGITERARNNPDQATAAEPMNTDAEVRPPIPPVRQVLVDDYQGNPYSYRRNNFDGFRNYEQETRWQEQRLMEESAGPSSSSSENTRSKTFEDLFRPPLDLIYRGNFDMAKFEGQRKNMWLMVNIQNPQEFACQVLNRDVWSNSTVKSILKEHFIFWQSYNNTTEGQKYINFYNVATFPYVSIVDPRTGEKMISWHEVDTISFCEKVTQFLLEHPSPGPKDSTKPLILPEVKNKVITNIPSKESFEAKQIKAAIKASLDKGHSSSDDSISSTDDSDDDAYETPSQAENEKEDWKNFLGSDDSPKVEIVIRYPNGDRENVIFPSSSKMKALLLYVAEKGFNMEEYDLITNFPKKNLSSVNEDETLEKAGIHSRDLLYVQMKH